MRRSITKTRKARRGRPFIGATPVQVRMPPAELAVLDDWIARQDDTPTRPAAIRRLVGQALAARKGAVRPPNKEAARQAARLATREIEGLGDRSRPAEEQQQRKRRLIRGPKEFRDIRADQPKTKR